MATIACVFVCVLFCQMCVDDVDVGGVHEKPQQYYKSRAILPPGVLPIIVENSSTEMMCVIYSFLFGCVGG